MTESLKDWLKSDTVKELSDVNTSKLMRYYFFRDECRPTTIDKDIMFSPADGIILYQKILKNKNDGLVEIKGKEYNLDEAIDSIVDIEYPCIVIGIFMTAYDVHINRMPTAGILSHYKLEPIASYNKPMLAQERDLLNGSKKTDLQYLFNNERVLNRVYEPQLNLTYYFMQIADYDVRMIIPFEDKQTRSMLQSERMGMIRWGSQCDLIIPYSNKYDFNLLQGEQMHVKAGVDPLIRINKKISNFNRKSSIKIKDSNNMMNNMIKNIDNGKKYIEAEGGEFILKNSSGDMAIIPAKDKDKIQIMIDDNNNEGIDNYISHLPKYEEYAKNGTVVPNIGNTSDEEGTHTSGKFYLNNEEIYPTIETTYVQQHPELYIKLLDSTVSNTGRVLPRVYYSTKKPSTSDEQLGYNTISKVRLYEKDGIKQLIYNDDRLKVFTDYKSSTFTNK